MTKRPLTPTTCNQDANNSGGKALCFDVAQIQPVIMKRSEIYNNKTPPVALSPPPLTSSKPPSLPSCLRQSRTSWATPTHQFATNDACSVQFRTKVAVRRIPSRHDYSESVRADLWCSIKEIKENALRNEAEFSFDGDQWRNCSEEKDFYLDRRTGALVHPVHVGSICVYNGTEWKPIDRDEAFVVPTTPGMDAPEERTRGTGNRFAGAPEERDTGLPVPSNQVCIVCSYGSE